MLNRLVLRTSPWGLLTTGLVVGIAASPVVRKSLRAAVVRTTMVALSVTDAVKSAGEKMGQEFGGIVSEAKSRKETQTEAVESKVRSAGVAAVGSGLAAVDKVKEVAGGAKQKWDELVAEARESRKETVEKAEPVVETTGEKALTLREPPVQEEP